jgi:hypothetical protein
MADQRELQRKNQELIRKNRQLEHKLQNKKTLCSDLPDGLIIPMVQPSGWSDLPDGLTFPMV